MPDAATDRNRKSRQVLGIVAAAGAVAILATSPRGNATAPPSTLRVDPNTASPAVLLALPNLGPARVAAIVEARAIRPFRSAEDLDRRVKGIGPAIMAGLAPYLRFDPPPHPGR